MSSTVPGILLAFGDFDSFARSFLWPFLRMGGLLMAAPLFSAKTTPARVRLLIAAILAFVLAPLLPPAPAMEMLSAPWVLAVARELLIGVALGFVLQAVFEAIAWAGELCSTSVGLGFAQMADPMRGTSSAVVSQWFLLVAMTLFVLSNGHLQLIELAVKSFALIPPGQAPAQGLPLDQLVRYVGHLLAGGTRLALPVVFALLLINLAFGVITRATPALNLFALGFPITLLAGLLLLQQVLPLLANILADDLAQSFAFLTNWLGAAP